MKVIIELKQADADGLGGEILTDVNFARIEGSNSFSRSVIHTGDARYDSEAQLAHPFLELLADSGIKWVRVKTENRMGADTLLGSAQTVQEDYILDAIALDAVKTEKGWKGRATIPGHPVIVATRGTEVEALRDVSLLAAAYLDEMESADGVVSAARKITKADRVKMARRAKQNAKKGKKVYVSVGKVAKGRKGGWKATAVFTRKGVKGKDGKPRKYTQQMSFGSKDRPTLRVSGGKLMVKSKDKAFEYGAKKRPVAKKAKNPKSAVPAPASTPPAPPAQVKASNEDMVDDLLDFFLNRDDLFDQGSGAGPADRLKAVAQITGDRNLAAHVIKKRNELRGQDVQDFERPMVGDAKARAFIESWLKSA